MQWEKVKQKHTVLEPKQKCILMTSRKKEEKREKSMKKEKAVFNMFQTTRTRQKECGILCWILLHVAIRIVQLVQD